MWIIAMNKRILDDQNFRFGTFVVPRLSRTGRSSFIIKPIT